MDKNTKRKLVAGAVAAVAVAGGGVAIGATQFTSPKEESQAVINDAAHQLGVDPTKLTDALKKALENRIDDEVAAGRLTKAEGDAMKAKIEAGDSVPLILPGLGLDRGFDKGFGFGPGFRLGIGPFGESFDAAASYLGITEAQLRTELENGKTLAEIATAHGKTANGLVQALYDAQKKQLDAAVTAGKLTQSQEDSILANLKDRLGDLVNGKVTIHIGPGYGPFAGKLDTAAGYLGLTEAELRTELESGKTLAQIATAHGKTADGLIQAMYDAQKKQLDAAVTAGKLTQSQEDELLPDLKERITDFVNGRFPRLEHGLPGFRDFRNTPSPPSSSSATA